MQWTDKNLTAGGEGGKYYKFASGDNIIRIVSEAEVIVKHFMDSKYLICRGKDKNCVGCQKNNKPQVRWLCWVIDRSDNSFKLCELPYTVTKAIGELATSVQYGFENLPPYDITIKKTGEGLDTEYTVIADRNDTELTEEELIDSRALKNPVLIVKEMKSDEPEELTEEGPF